VVKLGFGFCFNLITFGQTAQHISTVHRYAVVNQNRKDVPFLCKNVYSQGPCTLDAGIDNLELVQSALDQLPWPQFKILADLIFPLKLSHIIDYDP